MRERSLQGELRKWLLIIVAVFGIVGTLISFTLAYFHAKDLQDDFLEQIGSWIRAGNTIDTQSLPSDFDDEQIIIQPVAANRPLRLPTGLNPGFHNLDGERDPWRILIIEHRGGRFAIAQQTELREEIAFGSALTSALPFLFLSASLFVGLRIIFRRQLRPINRLAQELNHRDSNDLTRLDVDQVPEEITLFVNAINQLLVRVEQSIKRQQRFIADAAHELRTPVAGLSLLAENHQNNERSDTSLFKTGLYRLQTLVEQLLNLARLQADTPSQEKDLSANELLREVVVSLHPLADNKNQDLGVTRNEAIQIIDRDNGLWHVFQNAISNAIRYTPEGGSVDVALFRDEGSLVFMVEDNGPGIASEILELVFEPFHRGRNHANESNGLGLAICRQIAEKNNGSVSLNNRESGGARFLYKQPLTPGHL